MGAVAGKGAGYEGTRADRTVERECRVSHAINARVTPTRAMAA
ncbi:MAG: hypothetical protein OXG26_12780 [Caldilineaceae bacterium]|nr:hypothetical protein [Caldilineaceae bacterium]